MGHPLNQNPTLNSARCIYQYRHHIGYKFELSPRTKFVINAGQYIAYGIGGKAKGSGNSEKIFGDNGFKRLDYGVGAGIGIELSQFCISGGYDLGLTNVSDVKGTKIKNRNAYLTLGYKFYGG